VSMYTRRPAGGWRTARPMMDGRINLTHGDIVGEVYSARMIW
jgi:hypothetical protein